jgi:hypothetical protein
LLGGFIKGRDQFQIAIKLSWDESILTVPPTPASPYCSQGKQRNCSLYLTQFNCAAAAIPIAWNIVCERIIWAGGYFELLALAQTMLLIVTRRAPMI